MLLSSYLKAPDMDIYINFRGIEYAEVTLPLLMSVITQMNNKVDSEYFINLKGFLVKFAEVYI